ncbi:MAG: bifunctional diaminohydroxyphosphoribosylaminopyrimidine deaminase/5-amino-6-(5-phosphoribosylamino)uracil reductase RibD [Armatimonadota bacterium]|nr:bifunctional diaminohydroxyphosphoribosylaminopyrimidine deaminase/5-amino-6-(5-phosphoribosylamino)uracil reductase RibD [Armatimonadota bacterium]
MRLALRLARRGRTSPNPMVGAVVVKDGVVAGQGFHPKAGEPHAEVLALRRAGEQASGAALYVTLEPCCHFGRTPPCVDTVIESGVSRVVAAMTDPNPKVAGRGLAALRKAGIEVFVGVLEREARALNEAYIKYITTGFPLVTLKMAMSLDGKIATHTGESRWVSGEQSRCLAHRLRSKADAVVVGAGAALADDPQLTARHGRPKWQPARIIVDESARISPDARIFQSDGGPAIIATTRSAAEADVRKLEAAGSRILVVDEKDGLVDLAALFRSLAELGMIDILLEGGGELNAGALEARLVDKVVVFVAPKIIGGRAAKTPVEGRGTATMAGALRLTDLKARRCGEDVMITARPEYSIRAEG